MTPCSPLLAKLPNLIVLDVFKTDVRDDGLKQLVALKKLKDLDLRWTLIGDAGVANLKGLDALKALKLQDTRTMEACLDSVLSLPALERLGLSGANFGDSAVKKIGKATRLRELQFDDYDRHRRRPGSA